MGGFPALSENAPVPVAVALAPLHISMVERGPGAEGCAVAVMLETPVAKSDRAR